ncbi:MAG: relaxase/mobilization nuclease domain-containing protein [Candidatus Humimicrobiaceae bacterium]
MAVIKIIPSNGSLKKIIDYVLNKDKTEERIIGGKDCSPENALSVMNATKNLYNKTDGRSYYHIIQSFKPGEVSPELAHDIGKELAEKQFKGYEVLIATHVDKEHLHNHIVVNSVSFADGHKLYSSEQFLREIKRDNDRICKERGLSVIEKPYAPKVYDMAEYRLAEKGLPIWKEQLRAAIDEAKVHSKSIDEMGDYLEKNFNIKIKIQNKNLSFLHPDKQKYCRGNKLGNDYTKDEVFKYFERGSEDKKLGRGATDKLKAENPAAAAETTAAYEKWKEENPKEAKEAYEKWKEENPEEAKAAYKQKNLDSQAANQPNIILSKIGLGIEGIAKKISRDIEKEKIRVDKVKIRKDKAREKYRGRDRSSYTGREREKERER